MKRIVTDPFETAVGRQDDRDNVERTRLAPAQQSPPVSFFFLRMLLLHVRFVQYLAATLPVSISSGE